MTLGKAVLGVLAGAAAGALIGLLFAPEKGTVTRKKVLKQGEELKDKFDEFVDSLNEKMEDLYEDAEDFAGKTTDKYKKAKREAEMN